MQKQSQHDIESLAFHFFGNNGTFLEIGCWDGVIISQTAYLEKEHGWTGVCVDPFPRNFEGRKCQLIKAAVSEKTGSREFVKVSIDRENGGDVSYFSGFKDSIKKHWKFIQSNCDYEIGNVPTVTISEVLAPMPKYITLLSIDTEGSEVEILKGIDFDTYSFGMIDVEHNEVPAAKKAIASIMSKNGYKLLKEHGINDTYINVKHGRNN